MTAFLLTFIFVTGMGKMKGEKHYPSMHPPMFEKIEEKESEALSFLSKYIDTVKVKELKKDKPEKYRQILMHTLKEKRRLKELKEVEPEAYKIEEEVFGLEAKTRVLAYDYRKTENENEKKEIEKNITPLVDKLFDLKSKSQELEINRLEKRINEVKEMLEKRKKNKEKIVRRHIDELLCEEYLHW